MEFMSKIYQGIYIPELNRGKEAKIVTGLVDINSKVLVVKRSPRLTIYYTTRDIYTLEVPEPNIYPNTIKANTETKLFNTEILKVSNN